MQLSPTIPKASHRADPQGRCLNATRGFSLVEVLVAILVLGIALVGLTQGITLAVSSSKESELQTAAALLAAGQIESLRAENDLTDGQTQGDGGEGIELYQWQQTITSTSIPGLHEVVVVVENSRTGQAIYELHTLLFQPPEDSTPQGRSGSRRRPLE